ncbi:MAG: hypothetical protein KAI74_05815, partial [Kiritimatiellae bacterium]|nr:hypothetical protein [Kiritimatiellia bacterium]
MSKLVNRLFTLLSILFLTTSIHTAEAKAPTKFHGVKCSNVSDMENLEKLYPQLTATWVEMIQTHRKISSLPFIFGTTARPAAEKEIAALATRYKSIKPKFEKQAATYKKKLQTEITKTSKRLSPLKNPSSATLKKRKSDLQAKLADQKAALATITKIEKIYNISLRRDIQRLRLGFSKEACRQLEERYSPLITARMKVNDSVADIERINKKGKANLTATDKKNIQRAEMKLATSYKKLTAMVDSKKKVMIPKEAKLTSDLEKLNLKITKAEKAKRKTDKLDDQPTATMMSTNILTVEIQMLDKLAKSPQAEKLIAGK